MRARRYETFTSLTPWTVEPVRMADGTWEAEVVSVEETSIELRVNAGPYKGHRFLVRGQVNSAEIGSTVEVFIVGDAAEVRTR